MMIATAQTDFASWDYMEGDYHKRNNISWKRQSHLQELMMDSFIPIKFSLKDPVTNKWTKWETYIEDMEHGYDVHRSILYNEIVVECDYPDYEKNVKATRKIGAVLEGKGWNPTYYYSGNKSIHLHLFLDPGALKAITGKVSIAIRNYYVTKKTFWKEFMEYYRASIISGWGMMTEEFDQQLIKCSHLIRTALSRNKIGYKTYIGDTYKQVSMIPFICNEKNGLYPKIGEIVFSKPTDINIVAKKFLIMLNSKNKKKLIKSKEFTLADFTKKVGFESEMLCLVESALKLKISDGRKRLLFIMANELKKAYSVDKVEQLLNEWNDLQDESLRQVHLTYALNRSEDYSLTKSYLVELLTEIGIYSKVFKED